MMGGFTQQVRNPDSWEGWYWGAKHVWGQGLPGHDVPGRQPVSRTSPRTATWCCSGAATRRPLPGASPGSTPRRLCYFWTQAGIKQVYICPDLNYGAAVHADKWIPMLPNTDAALQLAIIYMWINEGTYDKEYVKTHAVGMDKVAGLRPGQGRRHPQDAGMGLDEMRRAGMDDQGPGQGVGQEDNLHHPLLRRLHDPRPVLARARPAGVHPARHAGTRRARRPPVPDNLLRACRGLKASTASASLTRTLQRTAHEVPCWTTIDAWGKQLIPKTLHPGRHSQPAAYFLRQRRPGDARRKTSS